MQKLVLATLAALLAVSLAQSNCKSQLQACNEKNKEDRPPKITKEQIEGCFQKGPCPLPDLSQTDDDSGSHSKERGGFKGGRGNRTNPLEGVDKETIQKCRRQSLETCIRKTVPGFTMPEREDKKGDKEGHINFRAALKQLDSCDNKDAVKECIRGLKGEDNKPSQEERQKKWKENCEARKSCYDSLSSDCKTELENTKKAMCECHGDEQVENDFWTCVNKPKPTDQGQGKGKGKGKGKGGWGGQKDCSKLAEQPSCDSPPQFQGKGKGAGGFGGFKGKGSHGKH